MICRKNLEDEYRLSDIIKTNTEYAEWIKEVSLRFRNSQIKAATKVRREIVNNLLTNLKCNKH